MDANVSRKSSNRGVHLLIFDECFSSFLGTLDAFNSERKRTKAIGNSLLVVHGEKVACGSRVAPTKGTTNCMAAVLGR